jgi:hypothetical protein
MNNIFFILYIEACLEKALQSLKVQLTPTRIKFLKDEMFQTDTKGLFKFHTKLFSSLASWT